METGIVATSDAAPPDWRTSRKMKTFHRIQEEAIRLFLAKGYEETTVEEIAAAAGVSHMTVFRHFPTKESIVLTDEYDALIAAAIGQRPATEPVLDSIERAIVETLREIPAGDYDLFLARTRLTLQTPALQARLWANVMETQRVLVEALRERGGVPDNDLELQVIAAAAALISGVAALRWIEQGGNEPLTDLVTDAFAAARRAFSASPSPAPPC